MTYRTRNVVIAIGLGLAAMLTTLLYVTNYKRSVQHSQAQVQVYVAAHDIIAGTTGAELLSGHAFRVATVTRNTVVPGAISSLDQVKGLVVSSPLFADEEVTLRHFTDLAAQGIRAHLTGTMRAVQVPGDPNQLLAGTLQAGDHVDVVGNIHLSTGDLTTTVLRDVPVLVAPKDSSVGTLAPNAQNFAILALTDTQALKLFFLMKNADWAFALRPVQNATRSPGQVESAATLLAGGLG
jgi:Flp pilus assembly protein CpaB